MFLWLVLFLLVVGISFILAFRSMKDYQEIPQKSKAEYGLFLIRQTENFDVTILDSIGKLMLSEGHVISIERLFKGSQAALTIFGPKRILGGYIGELNLLELEDYASDLSDKDVSIWELGIKNTGKFNPINLNNIFKDLPTLGDNDQFFWQVVTGAREGKEDLSFQTQIRAAFYTEDPVSRKTLLPLLQNLKFSELIKIPKPFSSEQMMIFFKLRSLSQDSKGLILNSPGLMRILKI